MATVSEPKVKNCDRCGVPIIWNNTNRFFESVEFPKFKHCCRRVCNKDTCKAFIYFSNIAPKNPETGNAMPLEFPIPQRSKTDPNRMEWVPHVHRVTVPTDETTTQMVEPGQVLEAPNKPLPQGQNTLEYKPTIEETKVVSGAEILRRLDAGMAASTNNQDADSTLLGAINSNTQTLKNVNERLQKIEEFMNAVLVPEVKDFTNYWKIVRPKLEVVIGKVADGSIKSASDLIEYHQSEEQNVQ